MRDLVFLQKGCICGNYVLFLQHNYINALIMKKLALLLCTAVFVLVGCEKEDPEKPSETPTQIDSALAAPIQNFPATAEVIYDAVIDIEGHHYDAVKIGDQIWMASNLRTKHFADGEKIPFASNCEYDYAKPLRYTNGDHQDGNLITNREKRCGFLYNWCAVMHNANHSNVSGHVQGICPNGWHVPTEEEWIILRNTVASSETYMKKSGCVAKALADREMWETLFIIVDGDNLNPGYDPSKNNSTGFSALPAGKEFGSEGSDAYFWSCTIKEDNYVTATHISCGDYDLLYRSAKRNEGLSVRCVKD